MPNANVSERAGGTGDAATLPDSSKKSQAASAFRKATLTLAALVLTFPASFSLRANPRPLPTGIVWSFAGQSSQDSSNSVPPARITYSRTLRGSVPEYLAVVVNSDGSGTYVGRSLNETRQPRPLKLSEATTGQVFALAAALEDFRLPIESHKKVADLGLKTFTYEQGAEKHEVEFNYTTKQTARQLTDLFERIAGVEEHMDTLQYALKYDPLSLPQELLRIQIDLDHNALADPELMVPELQEIANNPRLLHIAQVRAQDIIKIVNHEQ
jgi:hypothetical protein